ncbi:MAG: ABC transporter substrate-binding protein [Phascolarctobacterium sp.]
MMRKIFFYALLLTILILTGCNRSSKGVVKDDGIQVTNINVDNYYVKGSNIQSFPEAPKRVVVVGENETETLLALGLEKNILLTVAQNSRKYSMQKENRDKFVALPKSTSGYLNMEFITQLHPDLIVAQQCVFIKNRLKNTEYWNKRNVKTLIPLNTNTPSKHMINETVDKEMQFIQDLGKAFRVEARAEEIAQETYDTIDRINASNKAFPKPKVMIVEFLSSMICYDKTKLVGDMVTRIGGQVNENPAVIGFENVLKEDPDVLFVVCSHVDYGDCLKRITDNPAMKHLRCLQNQRVYSIPLRFTYGTGCRTADGLRYLAERMYPGLDLEKK